MYTDYTYQDWLKMGGGAEAARKIVESYKSSDFFLAAIDANRYFDGCNPSLDDKYLLRVETREVNAGDGEKMRYADTVRVAGNRVPSSFLRRFVCQQNQYLLGNGVTLKDAAAKQRLGRGFDVKMQKVGEAALLHGVSYG